MQFLKTLHPVFLAALRKALERLLRGSDGILCIDFVRHCDLADYRIVGRVHEVYDLGSMGSDELSVDVGAIKGPRRIRSFVPCHFASPYNEVQPSVPALAAPPNCSNNSIVA